MRAIVITVVAVAILISYTYHFVLQTGYDIFPAGDDPSGSLMAAVLYQSTGDPDVLNLVTNVSRPSPSAHQVSSAQLLIYGLVLLFIKNTYIDCSCVTIQLLLLLWVSLLPSP